MHFLKGIRSEESKALPKVFSLKGRDDKSSVNLFILKSRKKTKSCTSFVNIKQPFSAITSVGLKLLKSFKFRFTLCLEKKPSREKVVGKIWQHYNDYSTTFPSFPLEYFQSFRFFFHPTSLSFQLTNTTMSS